MSPGRLPGPEGDGRCRMLIPGDGALLGGVARPKPESVSPYRYAKLSWSVLEPMEEIDFSGFELILHWSYQYTYILLRLWQKRGNSFAEEI